MQLKAALAAFACAVIIIIAAPDIARADGELTLRGAYYKERSTRVIQPMADWNVTAGRDGEVSGHVLVDSITSASVAAGAAMGDPFTEKRYELGIGYAHRIGRFLLAGAARYSTESDYTSLFGTLRGQAELFRKNTVLTVALARGHDDISNAGAQGQAPGGGLITGDLETTLGSISISQLISPVLVGGVTYDLIYLDGFQENPYRLVSAGGLFEPERVPDTRWRHAIAGSLRGYIPTTRSTLLASYRFYRDDWGITAHTPEAQVIQELKPGLSLAARYRYYFQTAADFYQPFYETADPLMEPYLTSDEKLGSLTTHLLSLEMGMLLSVVGVDGDLGDVKVEAMAGYLLQDTHYGDAVIGQFAVTVPFGDGS